MSSCAICTRHPHQIDEPHAGECIAREADLGLICAGCAQRIRTDLDDFLDAWIIANATVPWPAGGGDGRARTAPLPGGTDRLSFIQGADVLGTLGSWVRDWCETMDLTGPDGNDAARLTGWLRAQLPSVARTHPALEEFASEIRHLARAARRIAGVDADSRQRVQCPADDCGRWLRINAADPSEHARCTGCGTDWSVGRLVTVSVTGGTPIWLDPEAASVATGKDASTLRAWARSGKIDRDHGRYELHSIRLAMGA